MYNTVNLDGPMRSGLRPKSLFEQTKAYYKGKSFLKSGDAVEFREGSSIEVVDHQDLIEEMKVVLPWVISGICLLFALVN